MWRLTIAFLFVSILSVRAEVDLGKVIQNITSIVHIYDSELDRAVPFRELRASLVVLDSLALTYHGNCQKDITLASYLGYHAADFYFEAIDKMFRWCVKADRTCDLIIGNELQGRAILEFTKNMLRDGLDDILASLKLLEEIRSKLTKMRGHLTPVPSALKRDLLGVRDDYKGRRIARLRAVQNKRLEQSAKSGLGVASGVALAVLGGPFGLLLGAGAVTYGIHNAGQSRAGLDSEEEAREARDLAIMETFLNSLMKAVDTTIERIHAVKDNMNIEITKDQGLRGLTSGQIDIIQYMGDFPLTEIRKLKEAMRSFITRHGGGKLSRERREVLPQSPTTMQWETISHAVDILLDATATEREMEYWTL